MDHALDAKSAFGAAKMTVNATKQESPKARRKMVKKQSYAIDVPSTSAHAPKERRPPLVNLPAWKSGTKRLHIA